jgi:hypothetical protein
VFAQLSTAINVKALEALLPVNVNAGLTPRMPSAAT